MQLIQINNSVIEKMTAVMPKLVGYVFHDAGGKKVKTCVYYCIPCTDCYPIVLNTTIKMGKTPAINPVLCSLR